MRRPNIVVILSDQQRWDSLGCYGQTCTVSPHTDALAAEGTMFRYAFTPQPLCGPARACIQTGMYATATGCHTNNVPLPEEIDTVAKQLSGSGYHTAYFGKWHLGSRELQDHFLPTPLSRRGGFTERWQAAEVPEFTSNATGGYLFNERGEKISYTGYRTDAWTDLAVEYINRHAGEAAPFLLFLSFVEPHPQSYRRKHYDGPPLADRNSLLRDYIRYEGHPAYGELFADAEPPGDLAEIPGDWESSYADYLASCRGVDDSVGRMVECLKVNSLFDDTLLIFSSDHGNHFNTRNENDGKCSCHDASIRIPMVIRGPRCSGGRVDDEFRSLIDIAPTILLSAGLPIPDSMHGEPLQRPLQRRAGDEAFIQIGQFDTGRVLRTDEWTYACTSSDGDPYGSSFMESHLYHLPSDPHQLNNRITDPRLSSEKNELRTRLSRFIAEVEGVTPDILF